MVRYFSGSFYPYYRYYYRYYYFYDTGLPGLR